MAVIERKAKVCSVFNNEYLPVANITTLNVDVDITIQADLVFMFTYTSNNISYNFGYNYWGRSGESIKLQNIDSFKKTFLNMDLNG